MAAAGGIVYTTPYYLKPAFTDFTSLTATLKVYVSTNFAHPTILQLDDAAAAPGPYNAISTNVGAQTQMTTTAADRSQITRYLGLFVSLDNTATPYLGADSQISRAPGAARARSPAIRPLTAETACRKANPCGPGARIA